MIGVLTKQGVQYLRLLHLALVLVAEGWWGAAISTHFRCNEHFATTYQSVTIASMRRLVSLFYVCSNFTLYVRTSLFPNDSYVDSRYLGM